MRRKFILMVRSRIQFLFVAVRNGHRNRCDMWFPDSVCCCVAQSPARMLHTHYGYLLFQSCQCWWQQKQPIHRCQESNGRSIFDRTILIILTFNLRPFVYPSLSLSLFLVSDRFEQYHVIDVGIHSKTHYSIFIACIRNEAIRIRTLREIDSNCALIWCRRKYKLEMICKQAFIFESVPHTLYLAAQTRLPGYTQSRSHTCTVNYMVK